jgi:hypothetical protein
VTGTDHHPVPGPSVAIDDHTTARAQQGHDRSVGREHLRFEVRHAVSRGKLDYNIEKLRSQPTSPVALDDHHEFPIAVADKRVAGLADEFASDSMMPATTR